MEPVVNQQIFQSLYRRVYLLIVDGPVLPLVQMKR